MVTIEQVRLLALTLPRSTEAFVRGRVKFRVGRIVYLDFSRDRTVMGFAFPKVERDWLVGGEPDKFLLPIPSELRYHWVQVRLAAIDDIEMRELVLDAWRMVVPARVAVQISLSTADEVILPTESPSPTEWPSPTESPSPPTGEGRAGTRRS